MYGNIERFFLNPHTFNNIIDSLPSRLINLLHNPFDNFLNLRYQLALKRLQHKLEPIDSILRSISHLLLS